MACRTRISIDTNIYDTKNIHSSYGFKMLSHVPPIQQKIETIKMDGTEFVP